MKLLQHKGYFGSVDASVEDGCLFGKLEFIGPLVNYEGQTIMELNKAFKEAVDDYIAECEANNVEPAKPCKGSFNVRIGHKLHLSAMVAAREKDITLNEFVRQQVEKGLGS